MTPQATRRTLWLAALLLVPLPMLQFGAFVPVVRYLLLGGVTLGLIIAEGGGEIPYLFLGLMLGHALVYAGLLWAAAWAAVRGLWAVSPTAAGRVALAIATVGLLLALVTKPYVTPFSSVSLHSNLLVVLQ
jgi:hypothetical protein